uniref:Uncharacterized protein n=1 Tax=Triticum urartu TaxID=4572 RepID=A0A8R7PNU2_TRIUA
QLSLAYTSQHVISTLPAERFHRPRRGRGRRRPEGQPLASAVALQRSDFHDGLAREKHRTGGSPRLCKVARRHRSPGAVRPSIWDETRYQASKNNKKKKEQGSWHPLIED